MGRRVTEVCMYMSLGLHRPGEAVWQGRTEYLLPWKAGVCV